VTFESADENRVQMIVHPLKDRIVIHHHDDVLMSVRLGCNPPASPLPEACAALC